MWPRRIHFPAAGPFPQGEQRIREHFPFWPPAIHKNRRRVRARAFVRLLDHDGPARDVDFLYFADRHLALAHFVAAPNVGFLLRKPVPLDGQLSLESHLPDVFQSCQSLAFLQQVFVVHVSEFVVFPPRRLVLAAMPVQHRGQKPSGLVVFTSFLRVRGNAVGQFLYQLGHPLLPCVHVFGRGAIFDRGPGNCLSIFHQFLALDLQPIPQRRRRKTILAVVSLHRLAKSLRQLLFSPAKLQPVFHITHRCPRFLKRNLSFESVKNLQLLEGVFLHAGPQGLLENRMQVHKQSGPQHAVDLVFPGRVPTHQILERRRFVSPEVIHMHRRKLLQSPHHFIHEPLESAFLLVRGKRPALLVAQPPVIARGCQSEKVLLPASGFGVSRKRIALQIHKHVSRRRLRQSAKSRALDNRQQRLVYKLALRSRFDLHPRLLAHLLNRFARPVQRFLLQWDRQHRQFRHRFRTPHLQLVPLLPPDPRHQGQMIVSPPPRLALPKPSANIAMRARLRICLRRGAVVANLLQLSLYVTVVSRILRHPVALRFERLPGRHHPHKLRQRFGRRALGLVPGKLALHLVRRSRRGPRLFRQRSRPLDLSEQLRIKRQLQNRRSLGLPRQFAVVSLIGPVAKSGSPRDLSQQVRPPEPSPSAQRPLRNHLNATFHRPQRLLHNPAFISG